MSSSQPEQVIQIEGVLTWDEHVRTATPRPEFVEGLKALGIHDLRFALTRYGEFRNRPDYVDAVSQEFPLSVRSADGVDIHLASLHQENTEAFRLMVGIRNTYADIIEAAENVRARRTGWEDLPLLVVPPTLLGAVINIPVKKDGDVTTMQRCEMPFLPPVLSDAHLFSRARSRSEDGSALRLVWFSTGLGIPEAVMEYLRNLTWNAHAKSFDY
jgi:hypothetical protein